jgi:parallel beta helix pectate lyase-like protein
MNKLVYILLIIVLWSGCQPPNDADIRVDLSNKNIERLLNGNQYYKNFGIKTKIDTNGARVRTSQSNFLIETKYYYQNYNDWILSPFKLVGNYMPNYEAFGLVTDYKLIRFNPYRTAYCQFSPVICKELVELNEQRYSCIYALNDDNETVYLYDGVGIPFMKISDMKVYNSSVFNLENLSKSKYYIQDRRGIKFVQNPLTGYYSIYPDLRYYGFSKKKIRIPDNYQVVSTELPEILDTIVINGVNIIESDLIIRNSYIVIEESTIINFYGDADIFMDNCVLEIKGRKKNEVVFQSNGSNSFYARQLKSSVLDYVQFSGFSALQNDSIALPSAITFYNSDIKINNSSFESNATGDDLVNIFRCKFYIGNSTFSNSLSDALDIDFCTGNVESTKFLNCGNDGLDLSGSKVSITNCDFSNIDDKAISAGENSDVTVEGCSVKSAELALVSKDGAVLNCKNVKLVDNIIDLAVFQKKDFYNQPSFTYSSFINDWNYLIQQGSEIISLDTLNITYLDEVESLLYGNVYGKSSK